MMPAAFANRAFMDVARYAPDPSPQSTVSVNGSNVVRADFKRRIFPILPTAEVDRRVGQPAWKHIINDRLSSLHRLREGWDGPASLQIGTDVTAKARRLLDLAFGDVVYPAPPTAVPCGDGSVQLEWWLNDTRFEIAISPDGSLEAWALDRLTGHEAEAVDVQAAELLGKWSSRLTADKMSPAAK